MADPNPTSPQTPGRKTQRNKRRLPILLRHAISLAVLFVVALPLSYIVGQRVIRHRELAKLDSPDVAVFEEGMDYVYQHAPDDPRVRKEAVQRIQSLPPEPAAELFWVLANAMTQDGEPLPPLEVQAGTDLLERSGFVQKFVVYNQFQQLGVGEDERVLAALATALEDPDDRRFLQAVEFYDARFIWLREFVPDSAWLRWAVLLSHSQAALTQLRSAQVLGGMIESIADPQLAEGLARLAQSDNPMVRSEVLDVAAGYAKVADDPIPYEQVLIALTTDDNETLARRAWITLGLLNPLSGFSADWRSVEPTIAEAMLWAAVKTNPDRPEPAIEAWDAGIEYEAAMALHQSPRLQEQDVTNRPLGLAGDQLLSAVLGQPTTQAQRMLYWRCLPVVRRDLLWLWSNREDVYDSLFSQSGFTTEVIETMPRLIAATCFFTGTGFQPADPEEPVAIYQIAWNESLPTLPSELTQERDSYYELLKMLWPGGPIKPGDPFLEFEEIDPDLLAQPLANQFFDAAPWQAQFYMTVHGNWGRIEYVPDAVLTNLDDSAVLDLLVVSAACDIYRSDFGGIHHRDSAAGDRSIQLTQSLVRSSQVEQRFAGSLIAGMLPARPTLIDGVTTSFLAAHTGLDLDDFHGYTDAQLVELGLRRVDALTTLLDIAETAPDRDDRFEQIALLKLALWMRGDLGDAFIPEAEAMLDDDRLPTSTVLMCLLHMQRPAALYYLFDHPDANTDPPIDLYDLFVNQRWWHVFSRLVPDRDLELWLWGDPGAQSFQFEVMRQWVQANRWRLERGWWPPDK